VVFEGGDTNLSRYVRNSPISHTDPLGHDALDEIDRFMAGWAHALTAGLSTRIRSAVYGDIATRDHSGLSFDFGEGMGTVNLVLTAGANPCGMTRIASGSYRAIMMLQSAGSAANAFDNAIEAYMN